MKTVFGYVRVSGSAQAEKDGPIRQETAITAFCQQHGFSVPSIYSDLGVSGTVEGLDRPDFFRMLEEAVPAGAVGIVVERLDRLARDLIVSEFIIRELRSRNIALYAADHGLVDLATADADPSRKLIRQIFSAMAEYEKSALVIKLRVARDRKKRETGKCEGKRAFGAGDESEGKAERIMLNLIRQLRDSGVSWRTIAIMFGQHGFKKRNGKTNWRGNQIWALWQRHTEKLKLEEKINT